MSPFFQITGVEIDRLISILRTFKENGFVLGIRNELIQLLAGDIVHSISPNFIISQPEVLKLFLLASLVVPDFLDFLTF
jgi:hypothetical protein